MTTLGASVDWLNKILIEVEEDEEGLKLAFMWDEKDPELQLWTELGEEKQKAFVLQALLNSCKELTAETHETICASD